MMEQTDIEALFTRADAGFVFARWGRPIVPVVFGLEDESIPVVKGAIEAVVAIAGHKMAEVDPELGANLLIFYLRDWDDLSGIPNLGEMIPNLDSVLGRLKDGEATQYTAFRFDEDNSIRACFLFVRMSDEMAEQPAEAIALTQAVKMILLWSDQAFVDTSPLAELPQAGETVVRPEVANLIRAAYDPVLPNASRETSHALRLSARSKVQ